MRLKRTQVIVLKKIPLAQEQKICVIALSQDYGLLSFVSKQNPELAPFAELECLLQKRSSDLFSLKEQTATHLHLELRSNLQWLQTAGSCARHILKTQLPGKATPHLYTLLRNTLAQISQFPNLPLLGVFFKIKLMIHEGIADWSSEQNSPIPLQQSEREQILRIVNCRSFQTLAVMNLHPETLSKLEALDLFRN